MYPVFNLGLDPKDCPVFHTRQSFLCFNILFVYFTNPHILDEDHIYFHFHGMCIPVKMTGIRFSFDYKNLFYLTTLYITVSSIRVV